MHNNFTMYRQTKFCLPVVAFGVRDIPATRADGEYGDGSLVLWIGRLSVGESAIIFNI